jgi:hypothetical protein
MARAGRKRKMKAQRRATTVEGRKPKQKATKERLARFSAITGRSRGNNMDNADATVIHLLFDAGFITEEQKSAALDYEQGYWHFVHEVFAKQGAVNFAKDTGRGSIGMPMESIEEESERKELAFKKVDARIARNPLRKIVHDVVLDDKIPNFFIKYRTRQATTDIDDRYLALLRKGLNALIGRE